MVPSRRCCARSLAVHHRDRQPNCWPTRYSWLVPVTTDQFRQLALACPEAIEGEHQDHPDFRHHGRVFATMQPTERTGMVKLPPGLQRELLAKHDAMRAANGAWGRAGCTMVDLRRVTLADLRDAMLEAWQYAGVAVGKQRAVAVGKQRAVAVGKQRAVAVGKQRAVAVGKQRAKK
jgi:hypothetical protein